jgi:hypothetical protein
MRMRVSFLTVVLVSVMAVSQSRHVCMTALARSAQTFTGYFHALRAESVNPVESLVLSLVLANTQAQANCKPVRHGA